MRKAALRKFNKYPTTVVKLNRAKDRKLIKEAEKNSCKKYRQAKFEQKTKKQFEK